MHITDFSDFDGASPNEVCMYSRVTVCRLHKDEMMIALRFYSDNYTSRAQREDDTRSIDHIRGCRKCEQWMKRVIPEDVLRRQKRMTQYCCSHMFCAVEEYQIHSLPRFRFGIFRMEDPCWYIDDKLAFAQFCPWCGSRLPPSEFIKDETEPNQ